MIYQVEIQNVHFQLGFDDEIVEPMTSQDHSVLSENRGKVMDTVRSEGFKEPATMRSIAIARDSIGTTSVFEIAPFSNS